MFERGISVIVIVATLMLSVTGCGSRGVIDRDENTSHPIDYKIICDKDVSKDSLLMSTTDFILHTNNLSKPSFAISEKIKNKFNLWIPDRFEPQGQLMELWSIDDYRRSRHRISGVYQERGECKNYPDGWYINPIYGDDNFYNPFTGKIYKNQYPPGLLDIENKLSIQLVEFEDRITALQMVNFSNTPVWTLNSLPMMRDLRLCIMENYVITNSDYIGYHLIDISAGTVLCRLVNTYYYEDIHSNSTLYNARMVYSKEYLWSIAFDFDGNNSRLYRFKPKKDSVEIMRYDIDNPKKVFYVDDILYVITNDGSILKVIDPDSGMLINSFDIDDYINGATFHYIGYHNHPFLCKTENKVFIFNPDNPEKTYEVDNYPREITTTNNTWDGYDMYWCQNEKQVYGMDTKTGEKTWWIPKDELGEQIEILIADWRGVLVVHGDKISAYGIWKD